MPEITFIFGPNNSFFFDCPQSWKNYGLPQSLRQLFISSMQPAWRIAQPYCLALAPQINAPEPLWYIGCKVLNGEDKIFYSQTFFDINYPDLAAWIKTVPNAPRSAFVTFGAGYSYYASAPGHGSVWAAIPSELSDKVQKAFDTPCCVSLGVDDAWFVMWPDGYFSWKFQGHYSNLDKILTAAEPRSVSYLAISPYNPEHYFVAFRDRTVQYNFIGAPPEWMQQMHQVFSAWQAARQRQAYPQGLVQTLPSPPQQWSPNLAQQPPAPGFASPQTTPGTPMSNFSNPSSGLMSPPMSPPMPANPPYGYRPPQAGAVEMAAETGPSGPALAPPAPVIGRTPSTEKKKKFLSKLFA